MLSFEEVKRISNEFNKQFAFKNDKVIFEMYYCSGFQNYLCTPELRPNKPFVFSWIFPRYQMEKGELWYCHSSQYDVNDNHRKVDYHDIMTEEEYQKYLEGLKYWEDNLKSIRYGRK